MADTDAYGLSPQDKTDLADIRKQMAKDDPRRSKIDRLIGPDAPLVDPSKPTKFEQENQGFGRQFAHRMASYLPAAGGVVGGVIGAGGGIPTGPGAIATGAAGAALGGAAGSNIEHTINRWLGFDAPKTMGEELKAEGKEALIQGGTDLVGGMIGRAVAPSIVKTINKLYYAGKLGPKAELEAVMPEVLAMEKNNPAKTLEEFTGVLKKAKNKIGNEVDIAMRNPVMHNGNMTPLGAVDADVTPVANQINSLAQNHISDITMNPAKIAAAKSRAAAYSSPKTFEWLTDRRIVLNRELNNFYSLTTPAEKAQYLATHPEFEIDKMEADAIRDIIYPQMDKAVGAPSGYTAALQKKRGALMSVEEQSQSNLAKLTKESKAAKGAPQGDRLNAYGTSHGRIGISARLESLIKAPDKLAQADKQVSRAFTHTPGTKVGKILGSRYGQEGMELPIRTINRTDTEYDENKE